MNEQQQVASTSNTTSAGFDVNDQLDVNLDDASSSTVKNPKVLEQERIASEAKRQYYIAMKNVKIEQKRDNRG